MEEKLYHIVDPETGEIIEKRYIRGLSKLLYQMVATGWSKRLRWALRVALFLCIVLAVAEPVLRERFPAFYDRTEEVLFLSVLVVGGRILSFVLNFFEKKHRKPAKFYQIIDPETGKNVDTLRPEDVKNPYDTTASSYKFARAVYYRFTVPCSFLTLLFGAALFFVPNNWQPRVGITAAIFCALVFISNFIWRYNLYEKKDKGINKFERAIARFSLVCYILAALFGLAACFAPSNWISRVATVGTVLLVLACIGDHIWLHEQIDDESDDEKDQ